MRNWTIRTNDTAYPDIKTYTILEPNPDAGKSGVCYSGKYFGVTTLDSKEDAHLISAAPELLEALKAIDDYCQFDVLLKHNRALQVRCRQALAKAEVR